MFCRCLGRILLCPYHEGTWFTIQTTHGALKWILHLGDATDKLAQFRLWLPGIKFAVDHSAGFMHQAADALSRLSTTGEIGTPTDEALSVMLVVSPPDEDEKVCIDTTDVIDNYDDTGFTLALLVFVWDYPPCVSL